MFISSFIEFLIFFESLFFKNNIDKIHPIDIKIAQTTFGIRYGNLSQIEFLLNIEGKLITGLENKPDIDGPTIPPAPHANPKIDHALQLF